MKENDLMHAYSVEFETTRQAILHLGKLARIFEKNGRITVLDVNPKESSYLKNYGWNSMPSFKLHKNVLSIPDKYEYLGNSDNIDCLHLQAKIIDILHDEHIDTVKELETKIREADKKTGKLPIFGIGPVFSKEIIDAYENYVFEHI